MNNDNWDEEYEEYVRRRKKQGGFTLLPNFHLSSPIRIEGVEECMRGYSGLSPTNPRYGQLYSQGSYIRNCALLRLKPFNHQKTFIIPALINLVDTISNSSHLDLTKERIASSEVYSSCKELIESQLRGIPMEAELPSSLEFFKRWWHTTLFVDNILTLNAEVQDSHSHRVFELSPSSYEKFYILKDVVGYSSLQEDFIMSRDQFLMVTDLVIQRMNIKLASLLANSLNQSWYPDYQIIETIIEKGDILLKTCPIIGYKIIKEFEQLNMGLLLKHSEDSVVDNNIFYDSSIKNIRKEVLDYLKLSGGLVEPRSVINAAEEWITAINLTRKNIHHISQSFGLYRIWGHPIIDPIEGCIKLQRLCKAIRVVDYELSDTVANKFKEIICVNYKSKNGKWPNLDCSNLLPSAYLRKVIENNYPLDMNSPLYSLDDWGPIIGLKTFEVEDTFNLITVLSDKALSLPLDELIYQIERYKNIGRPSERRVLVEWLKGDLTSAKTLLELISQDQVDPKWFTIGVCPKEKEMKEVPRMFSLMTLVVRMYFVVTESIIATNFLPLLPQATMADDELTLLKKTFECVKNLSESGNREYRDVVFNADFEKWNSNMRHALVYKIFRFIDELSGIEGCIEKSHLIIEKCIIYLADSSVLPDLLHLLLNAVAWLGHKGGLEGIRQKGWTCINAVLIEIIAILVRVKAYTMVQGDNISITIRIFREKNMTDQEFTEHCRLKAEEFKLYMSQLFEGVNLPLKGSETWCSSTVLAYGKRLYKNGVQCSMSLKRLCRLYSFNNEGLPTLNSSVSTIFASCFSASLFDFSPIVPYAMAVFNSYRCIYSHLKGGPLSRMKQNPRAPFSFNPTWFASGEEKAFKGNTSPRDLSSKLNVTIIKMLMKPAILGGLPVMSGKDFSLRGFPDPLTVGLSSLNHLALDSKFKFRKEAQEVYRSINLKTEPDTRLIESPSSINLYSPADPEGFLKLKGENYLRDSDWIENKYMKTFLGISLSDDEEYKKMLLSMSPYSPRLANDIYSATLWGYMKSLLGRITSTRTMQSLSLSVNAESFMKNFLKNEHNFITGILSNTVRMKKVLNEGICSRITADVLRHKSWGLDRIEGITVPHPSEAFQVFPLYSDVCSYPDCHKDDIGYVLIKIDEKAFELLCDLLTEIGKTKPYFGSFTAEKLKDHENKTQLKKESLTGRAIQVVRNINWTVEEDSKLGTVIKATVASVTDLDVTEIIPSASDITGSADHRYRDERTDHGGFISFMYNICTYLDISTDSLIKYSKGGKNYAIHFQALMCWSQLIVSNYLITGKKAPAYHIHEKCKHCVLEIPDSKLELHTSTLQMPPSNPGNPYCWISKDRLVNRSYDKEQDTPPLRMEELNAEITYEAAAVLILEQIVHKHTVLSGFSGSGVTVRREVPNVWFLHLNPIELIDHILLKMFNLCIFNSTNIEEDLNQESSLVYSNLDVMSPNCFESLIGMYHFQECRELLVLGSKGEGIVKTAPYKRYACCIAIKKVMLSRSVLINYQKESFSRVVYPTIHRGISIALEIFVELVQKILLSDYSYGEKQRIILTLFKQIKTLDKGDRQNWYSTYNNPRGIYEQLRERNQEEANILEILNTMSPSDEFKLFRMSTEWAIKKLPRLQCPPYNNISLEVKPIPGENLSILDTEDYKARTRHPLPSISMSTQPITATKVHPVGHYKRPGKIITTAYLKYYQIIRTIYGSVGKYRRFIMLGDGTGGITSLLLSFSPENSVYYNTLISTDDILNQSLGSFIPPAVELLRINPNRLIGFPGSIEGYTDITSPEFPSFVGKIVERADMVLCDAEGGGWDSPEKGIKIVVSCVKIAKDVGARSTLIKTYLSNPVMVVYQLSYLSDMFKYVKILRSTFSGDCSTEVFLYAYGRRDQEDISFSSQSSRLVISKLLEECHVLNSHLQQHIQDPSKQYIRDLHLATKNITCFIKNYNQFDDMCITQLDYSDMMIKLRKEYTPLFLNITYTAHNWKKRRLTKIDIVKIIFTFMSLSKTNLWSREEMNSFYKMITTEGRLVFFTKGKKWFLLILYTSLELEESLNNRKLIKEEDVKTLKMMFSHIGSKMVMSRQPLNIWRFLYVSSKLDDPEEIPGCIFLSIKDIKFLSGTREAFNDHQKRSLEHLNNRIDNFQELMNMQRAKIIYL